VTRAYQGVLARIEADLAAERLGVGGRLPGERVLAERYGVSRASVREAIRVLEAMGLIRTATGSGPEAGAVLIADPAAPIGAALRWHLTSRHLPVADLVGARVLIESWSARTAAAHADPDALAAARVLLDEMDTATVPGEFLALDAEFHVCLARGAGNAVVAAIMGALRAGIQAYVTDAVDRLADWPAMADDLRAQHRRILTLIEAGEGEAAADAVSAHIAGFYAATGVGA
jgi:GntR family transcriptional repressor for pyruvate dehydrogenase complex